MQTQNNIKRFFVYRMLIISFLGIISVTGSAQISLTGGLNYANVRNNNLLENQSGLMGLQLGASVRYYPIKQLSWFSIQNEVLLIRKGYTQDLDKTYYFHFDYLALPILFNLSPVKDFSLHTGVELSELYSTNIKQGLNTYNHFDVGLVLGVSCLDSKGVSLYARATYGLLPMLDYYTIDKLGNFTGEIHDLKNISLSIGLKINLYNEKLRLYK